MVTTFVISKKKTDDSKKGFVAKRAFQGQRVLVGNSRQYNQAMSKVAEILGKSAK